MTSIPCKMLSLDNRVHRGTHHYIDDIVMQESVVGVGEVHAHLAKYGLETKEPEDLDGGKLLGIVLQKSSSGHLHISSGTPLVDIDLGMKGLTTRELFSLRGHLVGHYPIAGWLHIHCSFLKFLGSSGP